MQAADETIHDHARKQIEIRNARKHERIKKTRLCEPGPPLAGSMAGTMARFWTRTVAAGTVTRIFAINAGLC
jgi:hypothetical protein